MTRDHHFRLLLTIACGFVPALAVGQANQTETAQVLYKRHCAACHGDQGDGKGRAARYLFPKPRNFRLGRFRLVSSRNRVASDEDLDKVIERGIPGTSMPAFPRLSRAERAAIVGQVKKLWKQGLRAAITRRWQENDVQVDPDRLQRAVAARTTPSAVLTLPAWQTVSDEQVARGRQVYVRQNCRACHGAEGRGNLGQDLFNDSGLPTRARDFVYDPLKTNGDASELYRRIRLGMPGTPMPSSDTLQPEELVALVRYCQSLGKSPKRQLTNHQRATLAIGRPLTPPAKRSQ